MKEQAVRVVVLGGGITGLSAAYELFERAKRERRKIEVTVLEASPRVGGKIVTELREGVVIEGGPDSFITAKPQALELVRELGLGGELIKTNQKQSTVYVYFQGRLCPLPGGSGLLPTKPWALWRSPLLSWPAKARAALEWLVPPADGEQDESIGAFVRRRFGDEVLENIAGPMLGGIYAGNPDLLSLESTFPQLREMEKRGGFLRAAHSQARPAAEPDTTLFMTLKGGLSRLIEALALRLPPGTVRTHAKVAALRRRGSAWQVRTPDALLEAEAVVSALPAGALAEAVGDFDLELACVLREIPFVSTATVSMVYEQKDFPHPLDGFGFLVPKPENKMTSAATFTSTKFPGRAPAGQLLIRSFLGGAGREECAEAEEAQVARSARAEMREFLRLGERHPRLTRVFQWPKANPQYTVGHALRLRRIESCLQGHPGLALAGCSYNGVGIPDCIRSGREAALKALRSISSKAPAGVA